MKIRDKKDFDEINVFGQGEPNDGSAQYFSGESFLNVLNNSQEHGGIFAANVTFEPDQHHLAYPPCSDRRRADAHLYRR